MNPLDILSNLFTILLLTGGADPIRVVTSLSPKPYYVGQAIEVKVQIDPDFGANAIHPPKPSGADLLSIPSTVSRPGEYSFLLVPNRGGTIELPPFRARSGVRSGASITTRIAVANVPSESRASAFLGGVGPFDVRAEAEPSSVRPGQTFEFRVILFGSGAVGSVRTPDLSGWESPTLRIDPLDGILQLSERPVRTFRYRIRPTKGPATVLPQVAISAFEPKTLHYETKRTSSLTIRVEELPAFDPGRLDYRPVLQASKMPRVEWRARVIATVGIASASGWAAWFFTRKSRRIRPVDPVRLASELSRRLIVGSDEVEAACAVAEALTIFLNRVAGRPNGALTPSEARAWYTDISSDEATGLRAERLMGECDRSRFGSREADASDIIHEGRQFLGDLAGLMPNDRRG